MTPEPHIHPPKVEWFDLAACTNTDPKGLVRPVERYDAHPWGLYMGRTSDHVQFHYIESWMLPRLGIRATIFHFNPGHVRDQDYYVDIGEFTTESPTRWKSIDHYLDIVVRSGRDAELIDIDELLAAHAAGLLSAGAAQLAVERAVAAVDGIASHGYQLDAWLASLGIPISWR
jgi:predicted RNA-binding protein associated with RNAse of E/G family